VIIDIAVGFVLSAVGKACGLPNWQYILVFLSSLALDGDIILNEYNRWLKGEKTRMLTLDEYSYQHKFILHLPVVVIPALLLVAFATGWYLFFGLVTAAIIGHLIHDTVDNNFDGVRWLWPLNAVSYKIRRLDGKLILEKKTSDQLEQEAMEMAKTGRNTKKILKDNLK